MPEEAGSVARAREPSIVGSGLKLQSAPHDMPLSLDVTTYFDDSDMTDDLHLRSGLREALGFIGGVRRGEYPSQVITGSIGLIKRNIIDAFARDCVSYRTHASRDYELSRKEALARGGVSTSHTSGDHRESFGGLNIIPSTRGGGRGGGGGTTHASRNHPKSGLQGTLGNTGGSLPVNTDSDSHCENEHCIDIELGFPRGGGGTTHAFGDHPDSDSQGAVPTIGGGAARDPPPPASSDDVFRCIGKRQEPVGANEFAPTLQAMFSAILPAAAMSYTQIKDSPDHIKITVYGGLAFTTIVLYIGMLSKSNARGKLAMRLASCSGVTLFTFGVASQMSGAKYVVPTAIAGVLVNLLMILLKI